MSNENNLPPQILFIDDDSTVGQSVEGPLASYKVAVVNCQDLDTAIYQFNNQNFDVIFVELDFAPLHGLALVQKLRAHPDPEKRASSIVLVSGKTRPGSDENLLKELTDIQIITKPFTLINILPYLSRGLQIKQKNVKIEQFRENTLKLARSGQADQALEAIKKNAAGLGLRAINITCEVYEICKKYEEGLAYITPIADKDKGVMPFQYLKGHFLRLLGRYEEAKEPLEESYKNAPQHIARVEDMVHTHLNLNEAEPAALKMRELLTLNPEQADLKFDMFKLLFEKDMDPQAQKLCKDTTPPMDVVRYYNNRGVEFSKKGDIPGAIVEYERAIKLFPKFKENYRIYYNIALAHLKLKTKESNSLALTALKKCLELDPSFEKAKKTLEVMTKPAGSAPVAATTTSTPAVKAPVPGSSPATVAKIPPATTAAAPAKPKGTAA